MAVSPADGADPDGLAPVSRETAPVRANIDRPVRADIGNAAAAPVEIAFGFRDEALAAVDAGDPVAALDLVRQGLAVLAAAGLRGLDEAALRLALAEIEESLGEFPASEAAARAAVDLLGDSCPPEEDDEEDWLSLWCQAQERLAGLERIAGQFDAAAARLRLVLDRASAVFGEASQPVLSAANALGVLGKYSGDFDGAEAAYLRAMAALDLMPEPDPLARAALLHNLGGLAHSRGDAAGGIPGAELGTSIRISVLGEHHPDVGGDLNALGALYQLAGRYADAGDAYRRALAIFESAFGPEHFEVAMTCANLAVLYSDQADFTQAEAAGRRSLLIMVRVLGPTDAEVGLTLLNLAAAVKEQGRPAEAAELTARAAAILIARLPAGHPHVAAATAALDAFGGIS